MSRTFRFKKKHQAVGSFRYSHFADIRDNQPLIDNVIVGKLSRPYLFFPNGYLYQIEFCPSGKLITEVGRYTTISRHSSHKNPHYTSHWDDQVKGCWRDRANDADIRFDRRKKMKKMMGRQLLASR
jgi:hypothetical protein